MSVLSTNTKLIKVGQDYSAGSGISIDDGVISVTGEFGKTYSAGDNVDIYEQGEQLYISSKDWTNDIANASANAYNEAVAQIPDPFDPSYLSAQIDNKLNSSDFTTWQNGQYTTDLQTIEGQINNKLDTSSFSDVSGSFLTAHQSLDGYAKEDWVTAQGYITGVDLSNYYTKDETSGKEELAQAFADIPVGNPEVNAYVTDNSATINGTTDLVQNSSGLWNDVAVYQSNSANYLTAHQDISYKLDESAFADVSGTFLTAHQDLSDYQTTAGMVNYYTTAEADSLSSMFSGAIDYVSANAGDSAVDGLVHSNSAIWNDVTSYIPKSGYGGQYRTLIGEGYVFLSAEDTYNHTSSFANYTQNSIEIYRNSASEPYNQRIGNITINSNYLNGYNSTAVGSANSGSFYISYTGFGVNSTAGNAGISTTDTYLLNVNSNSSTYQSNPAYIRFDKWNGPSYSAINTGIGNFYVTTTGDAFVPRTNPMWVVRNASGDGFSIAASEAKGFDKDGNTIWSTRMSKATQLINGGSDPKPAILLTPMPTTPANSAQWSAAPYVSADFQSLTISYGPTASVPNIKITPDGITTQMLTGNSARASFSVYPNNGGVKFETSAGTWSLTGSVQKREIEYDADTSAITAIAGSAIGGGGVTGEFVPQSAFDELKASYDALSSLFATYSGQWLLPNEGEE